jgi:hypothetical protein
MNAQSTKHRDEENEINEIGKTDPIWFASAFGNATPEDLAKRYLSSSPTPITAGHSQGYDSYQRRLTERFGHAQRLADPEQIFQNNSTHLDTTFPQRPRHKPNVAVTAAPPKRYLGVRPTSLAILTLTACALGSAGGYVAANPQKTLAVVSSLWLQPVATAHETVVEKKVVHTAKLEVKDAFGAVNAPIPLDIAATPANADTPVALRITGLPEAAYLTKGVEIAAGEWMLKAEDLAQAELVVPHTTTPDIALQVSALEAETGLAAAPTQDLKVKLDMTAVPVPGVPQPKAAPQPKINDVRIVPASALADQGFNKSTLPPAVPLPLESINPEVRNLMDKGNGLLASGDVLAARQFYLKAYGLKAPEAAFGVGQTYDPSVYSAHTIKGLAADPKLAAEWYGKAAAAGFENATAAIAQLPMQP